MVWVEFSASSAGVGAVVVNSGGVSGGKGLWWRRQVESQWCRIRDAGTSLTFGPFFNQNFCDDKYRDCGEKKSIKHLGWKLFQPIHLSSGFGLWLDSPANGPGAKIPQNSFLNPVKCSRVWHNQPILRPFLEVLCPQALHFPLQSLRWRWWWGQTKGVNLEDKDMWLEEAEGGGSWQQLIRFESLAESFLTLYRSVNFLSGEESFLDLIMFRVSLLMIRQCFVVHWQNNYPQEKRCQVVLTSARQCALTMDDFALLRSSDSSIKI